MSTLSARPSKTRTTDWLVESGSTAQLTQYLDKHNCKPPNETTTADLPPTSSDDVRKLDEEALAADNLVGKWLVFASPDEVNDLWEMVTTQIIDTELWRGKVSTAHNRQKRGEDDHVIVVYTPNYFDTEDVYRVRDLLADHGITTELQYKPDIYTLKGIYPDTAADWGLESPARYTA